MANKFKVSNVALNTSTATQLIDFSSNYFSNAIIIIPAASSIKLNDGTTDSVSIQGSFSINGRGIEQNTMNKIYAKSVTSNFSISVIYFDYE